eukprot:g1886.t1
MSAGNKLESVFNFRDLGGKITSDGTRVTRRGLIYRCASTSFATDGDVRTFTSPVAAGGLHVKTIVDFRRAKDSKGKPNRLDPEYPELSGEALEAARASGTRCRYRVEYINRAVKTRLLKVGGTCNLLLYFLLSAVLKVLSVFARACKAVGVLAPLGRLGRLAAGWYVWLRLETMAHCWCRAIGGFGSMYFAFSDANGPAVKRALDCCADPERQPVVFHCTSGKDRTGVTAALLLHAAGVGPEDIVDDYHASHAFGLSEEHFSIFASDLPAGSPGPTPAQLREPMVAMMLGAPRASIEEYFRLIVGKYGSVDGYLDSIGCDEAWREALRRNFTVERRE